MSASFTDLVELARTDPASFGAIPRREAVAAAREYMAAERAQIRARHEAGESGANVVRMLTDSADRLLRGVLDFGLCSAQNADALLSRACLLALGGYGRGELSPHSDLDVCLLYEGGLDDNIRSLNSFMIPFLWDMGFEICYSIRSVNETMELVSNDLKAFTCVLESRIIAGDSTTFARLKLQLRELVARGEMSSSYVRAKTRERYELLAQEHQDLYRSEPNVKENRGGLRDFHTALWLFMMTYGPLTLDDAASLGIVSEDEHLSFVQSLDFLWRVRNELHFHAGKQDDRLTYENQKHVARAFGYGEGNEQDMHRLMQDYYAACRKLRRLLRIAAQVCDPHPSAGVGAEGSAGPGRAEIVTAEGQLEAGNDDSRWFSEQPSRLMEVFWECARRQVPLGRATERQVAASLHLVTDAFRGNDLVRRFFIAICNRPLQSGYALRQASNAGLLGRYLPEFEAVQGVICYEDFHQYPVDEHTLRAIEALAQLPKLEGSVGNCLSKAVEHLPDAYILVMAILFHDLGKAGGGEGHVERGVEIARNICRRIGMPEDDMERIAFLVEHHMLMTRISQHRDIDDSDIVESFAATMKTEERLRALFLLSYGDLSAVGPGVWNDWKGTLLTKLYLKTEKILLGRAEVLGEAYWKSPKADEVRRLVPGELEAEVDVHLEGLGERYFLAFPPRQIAQHLVCVAEAREKRLALRCTSQDQTGMSEIVVCTGDRHGLFSKIAGSFTSELIDINNAALFTRPDGIVVDCFTVRDATRGKPLTEEQFQAVETVLRAVLLGDEDVQTYVDRSRRRLFALLQPRVAATTRISFDNESSRTHTVVDVETGDRTGLLYDITRAMADAGLDIATARIVTDVRRVRDSFYVTLNGQKLEINQTKVEIREVIYNAIHPRTLAETMGERL